MASKTQTAATQNTTANDFPEDDEFPESQTSSAQSSHEALNGLKFNREATTQAFRQQNPPQGDWLKREVWECKVSTVEKDSQPGDLDPKGRTILTFTGSPVERIEEGEIYKPTFRLRVSPDRRYKEDGSDDTPFKLWSTAVEQLYVSIYGRVTDDVGDIARMLMEDEYVIGTYKGDSDLMINRLKTKDKFYTSRQRASRR